MTEAPSTLEYEPNSYPLDWKQEDRWFCGTVEDGRKVAMAPWLDSHPEEDRTPRWDEYVGWNWPGVRTDFDEAKKWADRDEFDWFLGTALPEVETDGAVRDILVDMDDVVDPDTGKIHPVANYILNRTDSYAQFSYSWTGIHLYIRGRVPEGFADTIQTELSDWPHTENPEVEVYTKSRFIAVTGRHVTRSGDSVEHEQLLVDDIFEKWGEADGPEPEDAGGIDFDNHDTSYTKTEASNAETTHDIDLVYDAIAHTTIRDVQLRSDKTEERANGAMSFDPSWEHSESGTRLGYEDGGFIYRKGMVGLDLLQVVALEERIISSVDEYPSGEDFWEAVEALRNRGADIPEYDPNPDGAEVVPILPTARISNLTHDEAKRYAEKRGIEWPSVEEVRDRLDDEITDAVANEQQVVKSAPTGSGKTHAVSSRLWKDEPDVTGDQPVIHAHATREARDQAASMSRDADVDAYTLRGRKELCPVAGGEYDPGVDNGNTPFYVEDQPPSEWIDHRCERQGIPFSVVHRWLEVLHDGELPCERGEHECPAKGQFEGVPRDDNGNVNYDVVHCTHQFLQVPGLRLHTNIFVDEKPSFGIELTSEQVRESVNEYLDYIDAPVSSYNELVYAAEHDEPPAGCFEKQASGLTRGERNRAFREAMDEALSGDNEQVECERCDGEGVIDQADNTLTDVADECPKCSGRGYNTERRGQPPLSWFRDNPKAHALAPAFTRAIWQAEEAAGDRKAARVVHHPPRFDAQAHDEQGWNRVIVDVVLDDDWEVVESESIPDFTLARSVVGLDAHPTDEDPYWRANLHPEIETEYTLTDEERSLYRRYERGLFTVQVGEGTQPVTKGQWINDGQGRKFDAIIRQLRQEYGDDFDSAITSNTVKGDIEEMMREAGVEDPETMHYGNEESRNDFAGKDVGLVIGSMDPGDHNVINLLSRLGYDADPVYNDCPECDGSGNVETDDGPEMCEKCGGSGELREHGRTFEGEDADAARAAIHGVREHHVAQSAGRWARDADDPEDNATVYIVTDAAPAGFIDAKAPGVTWAATEGQRQRLEYLRDQSGGATASEIADATGCSTRTAQRTLNRAEEEGLVEHTPGAGPHGAHLWWTGERFNPSGGTDLTPSEDPPRGGGGDGTATDNVPGTCTYIVAVASLPHVALDEYDNERNDWAYQSTFEWYEPVGDPPGSAG